MKVDIPDVAVEITTSKQNDELQKFLFKQGYRWAHTKGVKSVFRILGDGTRAMSEPYAIHATSSKLLMHSPASYYRRNGVKVLSFDSFMLRFNFFPKIKSEIYF